MSLKIKIAVSFFISASIIAILVAVHYACFIQIKKETRTIKAVSSITDKFLQLGRHEKDAPYFPKSKNNSTSAQGFSTEMTDILAAVPTGEPVQRLRRLIGDYDARSRQIQTLFENLLTVFTREKGANPEYAQLIQRAFSESPLLGAELLEKAFFMSPHHTLVKGLKELDAERALLRRNGEEILVLSEELETSARGSIDEAIRMSQISTFTLFPLFFVSGIVTLLLISKNVVNRLQLLINIAERTGKGHYSQIPVPKRVSGGDETERLVVKFNEMTWQLLNREEELERKNAELLQSKKLAAIGTLAAGVAHELNNPLTNIYISVQVLKREARDIFSPFVRETLDDIVNQTMRVKGIVGDLLEFARGKEPQFKEVELNDLIRKSYTFLKTTMNLENVAFTLDSPVKEVFIYADLEQMERVFINLFGNAFDAMSGKGSLTVRIEPGEDMVKVSVSDTGKGISPGILEKVFEPFFSTKDKGTGLGLAIIFSIVKKHGGDISVQSEEGKGTTFIVTLPKGDVRV